MLALINQFVVLGWNLAVETGTETESALVLDLQLISGDLDLKSDLDLVWVSQM